METRRRLTALRGLAALVAVGGAAIVTDLIAVIATFIWTSPDPGFVDLKNSLLISVPMVHGVLSLILGFILLSYKYFYKKWPFEDFLVEVGDYAVPEPKGGQEEHSNDSDPRYILQVYAKDAAILSNLIFERAGFYLYVGITIAFIGVVTFYYRISFQNINATFDKGAPFSSLLSSVLNYFPGAVLLFFIEFLAFYFLRQYRESMDEFRYFDAIRRNREENLVILEMFAENPDRVSTVDVLKAMKIYSSPNTLGKDETTEILENRRLRRDEMAFFEKILDVVKSASDTNKKETKK